MIFPSTYFVLKILQKNKNSFFFRISSLEKSFLWILVVGVDFFDFSFGEISFRGFSVNEVLCGGFLLNEKIFWDFQ